MPAAKYHDTEPLRISTRLPTEIVRALRKEAESRNLYLTDIVVEALRSHLKVRTGRAS